VNALRPKLRHAAVIGSYGWAGKSVETIVGLTSKLKVKWLDPVMVNHLVSALAEHGVQTEPFNMTVTDLGKLAVTLVEAATVVFATPTLLVGPHPSIITTAYLVNALRPKLKHAAVIGSYGWGGKANEQIMGLTSGLKVEWLDPVMSRGLPTQEDLEALDRLADAIATRHQGL